jgi:hypothetical protein
MNCPACQISIAPQSNFCFNCGRSLYSAEPAFQETATNKYRKFILFIAILLMSVNAFYWMFDLMHYFFGFRVYSSLPIRILSPFITLAFFAIPLVAGLIFPKGSLSKKLLIIMGSVYLFIEIVMLIKTFFIDPNPFLDFQF